MNDLLFFYLFIFLFSLYFDIVSLKNADVINVATTVKQAP